jgi:hypothetical protein
MEKPKSIPVVGRMRPLPVLLPLFSFGGNLLQRTHSPLPQPVIKESEYLEIDKSGVVLAIFTAEVDVKLNQKISAELHRSTKKNPPLALKCDLVYVSRFPQHRLQEVLMYLSDREGGV